jgi:hypothetical protein
VERGCLLAPSHCVNPRESSQQPPCSDSEKGAKSTEGEGTDLGSKLVVMPRKAASKKGDSLVEGEPGAMGAQIEFLNPALSRPKRGETGFLGEGSIA